MELVTLSDVEPHEMHELLSHEAEAWLSVLGWDYSPSTALIVRSIAAQAFSGFALRSQGRVVGYSYFVEDRERSLVGSAHALPEAEQELGASRLVDACLDRLLRQVRARRVESQFLYLGAEDPAAVFDTWGLERFPRQFLRGPLPGVVAALASPGIPGLRTFRNSDIKAAAAVIQASFVGSDDARMSECYRSIEGCAAFVEGVMTRHGCGIYEPKASFLHLGSGVPQGLVLASRIGPGAGHIVQLSVTPRAQHTGIGRQLLRASAEALMRLGLSQLSLSVTVANRRAYAWYRRLGLEPVRDFAAFVWGAPVTSSGRSSA